MKKGHDFKDYICPDSMERADDYVKLGEKYVRVLFLKDYASYIKDSMVSELTEALIGFSRLCPFLKAWAKDNNCSNLLNCLKYRNFTLKEKN